MLVSPRLVIVNWKEHVCFLQGRRTLKDWLSKAREGEGEGIKIRGKLCTGEWWYWFWLFSGGSLYYSYSLLIEESEWIFSTGATYHICPKREWFTSFEKLDEGLVSLEGRHICQNEGIGIGIKLFDGWWESWKMWDTFLSWRRTLSQLEFWRRRY